MNQALAGVNRAGDYGTLAMAWDILGADMTPPSQQKTVAILGGGVGGLSAAHELAERGFRVHVYERKPVLGGKARSIPVPGSGVVGRADLPGEHGFRFFPGFYRHLPDTMRRIPFKGRRNAIPT